MMVEQTTVHRRRAAHRRPALVVAAAAAAFFGLLSGPLGAPPGEVAALLGKKSRGKPKVLFTYRDYQLKFLPHGKGKGLTSALPRLKVEKIPPKPVSFTSIAGSVEGTLDKELATFPFTTHNTGALQLGFPRISGNLRLSAVDPPISSDAEDVPKSLEANYEQPIAGIGEVGVKVKSTGEWGASFSRQIEDIGRLRSSVNSHFDWSADLEADYPAFRGITPVINYGATQDGLRIKAALSHSGPPGIRTSYKVENLPGKHNPADFLHEGRVTATKGKHSVEAVGLYDRRFPKLPVRGSMAYTTRAGPAAFEASVDYDRYRLKAKARSAQVSAALGRKASLSDTSAGIRGRPAELEVKVGKVVASGKFREGKPRVRFDFAV